MAVYLTEVVTDLAMPPQQRPIPHQFAMGDNNAYTITALLCDSRNPEAELLDGTVGGELVRPDGVTVALAGEKGEAVRQVNLAAGGLCNATPCSVTLPQACFAVPGRVTLTIKLTDGTTITQALSVSAVVVRTSTDEAVDPGEVIPDLAGLQAAAAEALDAAEAATAAAADARAAASSAVRYDTAQTLTLAQQKRARTNVGAVGTDEMSAEFLCRMLFGNEDDWSVENYDSASFSATKTGRIITYKGNNRSNSGFQSVNLTGVPGAPHTVRSGGFASISLADTDFVPIPSWFVNVSRDNKAIVILLGYFHADRYVDENHNGYAVDYVLRRYNTETGEYEYSTRTSTPLGGLITAKTADDVDRISVAQLIPDSRGGAYVQNWAEWEEIAIFAIRRNRIVSGTVLLTPTYFPFGNQNPVAYSAAQTLTAARQEQARENIEAAGEDSIAPSDTTTVAEQLAALEARIAALEG